MRAIRYRSGRPGPGWHAHGTTSKVLHILCGERLEPIRLDKQRWKHIATGMTCHDRPPWDPPGRRYGLDVVVVTLAVWLAGAAGLHRTDWPWRGERPARRTVQRTPQTASSRVSARP
jgi:hypothetical protein